MLIYIEAADTITIFLILKTWLRKGEFIGCLRLTFPVPVYTIKTQLIIGLIQLLARMRLLGRFTTCLL